MIDDCHVLSCVVVDYLNPNKATGRAPKKGTRTQFPEIEFHPLQSFPDLQNFHTRK